MDYYHHMTSFLDYFPYIETHGVIHSILQPEYQCEKWTQYRDAVDIYYADLYAKIVAEKPSNISLNDYLTGMIVKVMTEDDMAELIDIGYPITGTGCSFTTLAYAAHVSDDCYELLLALGASQDHILKEIDDVPCYSLELRQEALERARYFLNQN